MPLTLRSRRERRTRWRPARAFEVAVTLPKPKARRSQGEGENQKSVPFAGHRQQRADAERLLRKRLSGQGPCGWRSCDPLDDQVFSPTTLIPGKKSVAAFANENV